MEVRFVLEADLEAGPPTANPGVMGRRAGRREKRRDVHLVPLVRDRSVEPGSVDDRSRSTSSMAVPGVASVGSPVIEPMGRYPCGAPDTPTGRRPQDAFVSRVPRRRYPLQGFAGRFTRRKGPYRRVREPDSCHPIMLIEKLRPDS